MKDWLKNLSIRVKVWLAAGVMAVSFLVFGSICFGLFTQELKSSVFSRALARGDFMRSKLESQLELIGEIDMIGDYHADLERLISAAAGIRRTLIINRDGKIINSTNLANIGKMIDPGLLQGIKKLSANQKIPIPHKEELYSPIPLEKPNGEVAGYLLIGEGNESYTEVYKKILLILALSFFIICAAGLPFLYFLFEWQLREPIKSLVEDAGRIANGDLTHRSRINQHDEIGQLAAAFEEMRTKLTGIVSHITTLSHSILTDTTTSAAQVEDVDTRMRDQHDFLNLASDSLEDLNVTTVEISSSVEDLAIQISETTTAIMQMAQAIKEVEQNVGAMVGVANDSSASVEEIAQSIRSVNDNLQQLAADADSVAASIAEINSSIHSIESKEKESSDLSREVLRIAEDGMQSVEKTYQGMRRINTAVMNTIKIIDSLGRNSEEIGAILDVINQVAEETNLLALNAAIIAAQSGEHGKSFSVVSDEIRDLAERVASSTQEISKLIETVQSEISQAVEGISTVHESVEEGEELSQAASGILKKILESSRQSQEMVEMIASATREQSDGTAVLTEGINRMTALIHQVARAINDQARGSNQILAGVDRMKDVVSQVDSAAHEQSIQIKLITDATEKIDNSARQISHTANRQKQQSHEITSSIQTNLSITAENSTTIALLKDEIKRLSQGASELMDKVSSFKLNRPQ